MATIGEPAGIRFSRPQRDPIPKPMAVEQLVSLREPRAWVYLGLSLGLAFVSALALDLGVRHLLRSLGELAADSPDAAALRAAAWLTGLSVFFCSFTLLVSGALFFAFRRAAVEQCIPPSGAFDIGAVRRVTGEQAVRMAKAGQMLAVVLGLCGLAFGGTACWFVSRVIACAARHV